MKRAVSLLSSAAALLAVLAGMAVAAPPAPELVTAATVKEAQAGRLLVEDSEGSYTVLADAQTVVEKSGAQIAIRDVHVGDRVMIEPRSEPLDGRAGKTIEAARIVVLLEVAH